MDEPAPRPLPPARPVAEMPEWARRVYESIQRIHRLDPSLALSSIHAYPISGMREGESGYPVSDRTYYREGTPEFELALLDDLLRQAYPAMFARLGGRISQGFLGNMIGLPNCTAIHGALNDIMSAMMRRIGYSFRHYEIVSIVRGPDSFNAHIYLGLRKKDTGELIAFADPWRGFERYSEWRPISEDTYSHDEITPWFMNFRPLPARQLRELVSALSGPFLTAYYLSTLPPNPPRLLTWSDTPQGRR
jgi:hypothetical protein